MLHILKYLSVLCIVEPLPRLSTCGIKCQTESKIEVELPSKYAWICHFYFYIHHFKYYTEIIEWFPRQLYAVASIKDLKSRIVSAEQRKTSGAEMTEFHATLS